MPHASTHPRLAVVLSVTLVAGCGGPTDAPTDPTEVPVLTLSGEPTLQIGMVEGDEDYLFQDVATVLRLASGNVVVADVGAGDIAVYAPTGAFVRRWGGRGEGPGEFRNLARVYPRGADSLMALDGWTARVSLFDTAGAFSHQEPAGDLTSDTLFTMDVWLYGRFWVDGALAEGARASVRAALDRLPQPVSGPGYRYVRVTGDGDLWVREPAVDANGLRLWTVVGADQGLPRGVIRIPARFDPLSISGHEVLGRWWGERDVNFVRAFDVSTTERRAPLPKWLWPDEPQRPVEAPDQEAFLDAIRSTFMSMARAQEMHYSTAMTYTARLDSLEWERPEDVVVDVVNAGPRGWVAVFTHPGLDRICGLGYGFTVPPGWAPGGVLCGPPARAGIQREG